MNKHGVRIDGYPSYRISKEGKVYSIRSGRVMSPSINNKGYERVTLQRDGKRRTFSIHRLVALHFVVGKYRGNNQVNHIDGNKLNNHYENLEWTSGSKNIVHSFENGLSPRQTGSSNSQAKLTDEQVREIKQKLRTGEKGVVLAEEYNISTSIISCIKRGTKWVDV